jgi:hypothetical protein
MVRIKFTARPRSPVVSPKFGLMAWDRALEDSAEQRETSTEQLEQSLWGQQMVASVESSSSHEAAFDHESQSRDFEDSKTGSDTSMRLKVAATAALARITYDFGQSTMMKTHLGSLQNHGQFFPRDMVDLLARSLCLSLGLTKLSCLRISLLLGFACPHIRFLWTCCVSSECNCIN